MKADPADQLRLLELQELDSRADRLRHQRDTLPELAELAELRQRRVELDARVRDARVGLDDLVAEQDKIDRDVESVRARRERDRTRMDQGLVGNPKDLERMQHEMVSLERRISSLEDDEIEVMERVEEAQVALASLESQLEAVMARGRDQVRSRDSRTAEIDAGLVALAREREQVAAAVTSDLVELYDKLRAAKDGVGAAELRARQCGGCRLTLDPAELGAIRSRPEDEVVRCEECQRILVRTAESGL